MPVVVCLSVWWASFFHRLVINTSKTLRLIARATTQQQRTNCTNHQTVSNCFHFISFCFQIFSFNLKSFRSMVLNYTMRIL